MAYEVKATSDHVRTVVEYDTFGSHGLSRDVTYARGLWSWGRNYDGKPPCIIDVEQKAKKTRLAFFTPPHRLARLRQESVRAAQPLSAKTKAEQLLVDVGDELKEAQRAKEAALLSLKEAREQLFTPKLD